MIMKTAKGDWKIHGMSITSSDSAYQKIKVAIETDTGLNQSDLQYSLGYRAPIKVDKSNKVINFYRF